MLAIDEPHTQSAHTSSTGSSAPSLSAALPSSSAPMAAAASSTGDCLLATWEQTIGADAVCALMTLEAPTREDILRRFDEEHMHVRNPASYILSACGNAKALYDCTGAAKDTQHWKLVAAGIQRIVCTHAKENLGPVPVAALPELFAAKWRTLLSVHGSGADSILDFIKLWPAKFTLVFERSSGAPHVMPKYSNGYVPSEFCTSSPAAG